jgi:hypothetical protein
MARKKKRARSRPIVTGYLEKVSSAIFDKYHGVITDMTMGQQGLYALYRTDKLCYVGLASNLRNRIKQHLKDRLRGMWTHFSLYIIRHPDHIKELESLLLCIAHPAGNKVKGKLIRSTDFLPLLKRKTKEAALEELSHIFKDIKQSKKTHENSLSVRARKAWTTRKRKLDGKKERACKGLFKKTVRLHAPYKGKTYKALLFKTGKIKFDGQFYDSLSTAGSVAKGGKATNGWEFWMAKNNDGELVRLTKFRN